MKKNLITFQVSMVKNPNVFWYDKDKANKELILRSAFLISGDNNFENISLSDETLVISGERYGGYGLGMHGGGARTGINNNVLVKGIGQTPLKGITKELYNSNGQYPLYEALVEVINHKIYSNILPIGVVNYFGIIDLGISPHTYTSANSHIKENSDIRISLGIREVPDRVGSYLTNPYFKPYKSFSKNYTSETERLRLLFSSMDREEFVYKIKVFLYNFANQMSFSRINSIAHGALSPSNISLDGRWLDLTNTTLLPFNTNYKAGSGEQTFFDEVNLALKFTNELLHNFNKFNKRSIKDLEISNYYNNCLKLYSVKHSLDFIGIYNPPLANKNLIKEKLQLFSFLKKKQQDKHNSMHGIPYKKYYSNKSEEIIEEILTNCLTDKRGEYEFIRSIYEEYFSTMNHLDVKNLKKSIIIRSLRRQIYSPLLYLGDIYLESRKSLKTGKSLELIKKYEYISSFVFGKKDNKNKAIIFLSQSIDFHYSIDSGEYILETNKNKQSFTNIDDAEQEVVKILECELPERELTQFTRELFMKLSTAIRVISNKINY